MFSNIRALTDMNNICIKSERLFRLDLNKIMDTNMFYIIDLTLEESQLEHCICIVDKTNAAFWILLPSYKF